MNWFSKLFMSKRDKVVQRCLKEAFEEDIRKHAHDLRWPLYTKSYGKILDSTVIGSESELREHLKENIAPIPTVCYTKAFFALEGQEPKELQTVAAFDFGSSKENGTKGELMLYGGLGSEEVKLLMENVGKLELVYEEKPYPTIIIFSGKIKYSGAYIISGHSKECTPVCLSLGFDCE